MIRRLVAGAPAALRPGGALVLEIGEDAGGARSPRCMAAAGFRRASRAA